MQISTAQLILAHRAEIGGAACLWLLPGCAQPSVTFVPCLQSALGMAVSGESSRGKEEALSQTWPQFRGLCPLSLRSCLCLLFTSFQFCDPSVSLTLFDAFSILALG